MSTVRCRDSGRFSATAVPLIGAGGNRLSGLGGDTRNGKWSGWPNGRRLGDDVVDIALTAIASGPTYSSIFLLSATRHSKYSFSHGTNDAQKTMGIITEVLVTVKIIQEFKVPIWVILSAHAAIALGTFFEGWRIVHTMGKRLRRPKPRTGFCAETGAAAVIIVATQIGLPVSTTHAIAGSLVGVGAIQRVKAVRWGVATNILWAWVLTIPAAAVMAGVVFALIRLVNPNA